MEYTILKFWYGRFQNFKIKVGLKKGPKWEFGKKVTCSWMCSKSFNCLVIVKDGIKMDVLIVLAHTVDRNQDNLKLCAEIIGAQRLLFPQKTTPTFKNTLVMFLRVENNCRLTEFFEVQIWGLNWLIWTLHEPGRCLGHKRCQDNNERYRDSNWFYSLHLNECVW